MTASDIRPEVVSQALRQMGAEFRTKDLSERPDMREGHPHLRDHSHYHAFVGTFLSQRCTDVERLTWSKHPRGPIWKNRLYQDSSTSPSATEQTPVPATPAPTPGSEPGATDLGPQSGSDNAFTARMRRHQSWYRARVLEAPCGTGPKVTDTTYFGNMLRAEDAERGLNFLSPMIHKIALERVRAGKGAIEPFRLLHNMLSSQPMCFNLLGPLVNDHALAGRLLSSVPGLDVAKVLNVQIEYAPEPAHEYLGDRTAFDAFIDYRRSDGSRAFVGIETKLTEPFSTTHYDSPSYRRWMRGDRAPWRPDSTTVVDRSEHNQLWRDHLLAIALRDHEPSPYAACTMILVRHPGDLSCARVVDGYKKLLRDGDSTFLDLPLDQLVGHWRGVATESEEREWLAKLETRYLDLGASIGG